MRELLILEIAGLSLICAAISATIISALNVSGVLEYWEVHAPRYLKRFRYLCAFCLGFWLCGLQGALLYYFFSSNIFYIAIPFIGGSIAKIFYARGNNR